MANPVFANQTAIVTGAASGIGRALSAALAARGARVVLADIDGAAAERAAATLGRDGSGEAAALDVRDADAFAALVARTVDRYGGIDFLFNNAGISMGGPTHELTAEHWERVIDVNLRGVTNGLLAAYPVMVEQGRGHLVNTASGAGLVAPPFVAPYAATKHAVVGLSTGLRAEAALHGVRVSVICPGSVETEILDRPVDRDLPATPSAPITARQYLAAVKQRPVAADRFAERALRQVARNRGIIVEPPSARSLWYLYRLSPRLVDAVCRGLARRVDRDLVRPRI
jgi:NAD(P)-dependent dehydrogenase (short-subunit alcohol dehydrogenase family)